jgi:hypothetical protein
MAGLLALDAFGLVVLIAGVSDLGGSALRLAGAVGFAVAGPVVAALLWLRAVGGAGPSPASWHAPAWWGAVALSAAALLALALDASPIGAAALAVGLAVAAWLLRSAIAGSEVDAPSSGSAANAGVSISASEAGPDSVVADERLEEARRRWQQRAAEGVEPEAPEG